MRRPRFRVSKDFATRSSMVEMNRQMTADLVAVLGHLSDDQMQQVIRDGTPLRALAARLRDDPPLHPERPMTAA